MKKLFRKKSDESKNEKNPKISKETSLTDADYNRKKLFKKGINLMAEEKLDEAVDIFEQAAKIDPTNVETLLKLGYANFHLDDHINALKVYDKILRPRDEMKRLLENRGVKPDSEIITYCGSVGTLSGLAFYALKSINLPNVKLYVRSFKEWKNLDKPTSKQEHADYWDLSAE